MVQAGQSGTAPFGEEEEEEEERQQQPPRVAAGARWRRAWQQRQRFPSGNTFLRCGLQQER